MWVGSKVAERHQLTGSRYNTVSIILIYVRGGGFRLSRISTLKVFAGKVRKRHDMQLTVLVRFHDQLAWQVCSVLNHRAATRSTVDDTRGAALLRPLPIEWQDDCGRLSIEELLLSIWLMMRWWWFVLRAPQGNCSMTDLLTLLTTHPSGHHYFHLDSHPLHLRLLSSERYRKVRDARRLSWKERRKKRFAHEILLDITKRLMTMVISSSSIEAQLSGERGEGRAIVCGFAILCTRNLSRLSRSIDANI